MGTRVRYSLLFSCQCTWFLMSLGKRTLINTLFFKSHQVVQIKAERSKHHFHMSSNNRSHVRMSIMKHILDDCVGSLTIRSFFLKFVYFWEYPGSRSDAFSHLVELLHQNPSGQYRNTPGHCRQLHLFLTDRSGYHEQMQSWSEVPGSIRSRSLLS